MKTLTILGLFLAAAIAGAQERPTLGMPTDEEIKVLFGADIGKGAPDDDDDFFDDNEDLTAACQGAASRLRRAYWQANRRSPPETQRDILVNGIEKALELVGDKYVTDPITMKKTLKTRWSYSPITRKALERGLRVNQLFGGTCDNKTGSALESCKERENRASSYTLSRFYFWVLKNIIPLEVDYFVPYERDYRGRCRTRDCDDGWRNSDWGQNFITAYAESAHAWLDFYLGRRSGSSLLPEGFYTDTYELRVAEFVSLYAAVDLNEDLFRRAYGCMIGDLREIHSTLKEYNGGNSGGFRNSMEVVNYARGELTEIANWISRNKYCPGRWSNNPGVPR